MIHLLQEWEKVGKFFGTYKRNLDNKYRLQVPNKLVKELPARFYMLRGFEGCISIYLEEDFDKLVESLGNMSFMDSKSRAYMRLSLASVDTLEVDSHGRISLGAQNVSTYKLSNDVTIIGVLDHFEIWDSAKYNEFLEKNLDSFEDLANDISAKEAK